MPFLKENSSKKVAPSDGVLLLDKCMKFQWIWLVRKVGVGGLLKVGAKSSYEYLYHDWISRQSVGCMSNCVIEVGSPSTSFGVLAAM